jgi:hypothetical protein
MPTVMSAETTTVKDVALPDTRIPGEGCTKSVD